MLPATAGACPCRTNSCKVTPVCIQRISLSGLELFEGGEQLGPAFAARMIIERLGQGSFSHWDRDLFFSTSDNTDPRVSDRTYLVKSWVSTSTDLLGTIRKLEAEKRASAEALARLSEEIPQMKAEKRASAEALAGHACRRKSNR